MTLSIIIPCYNHGHFIQDAIDSVLALKGIDYEIIIIDDGSTVKHTIDKLEELKTAGFNVLSQKNSGLGATRNKGVQASSGKYILPLDADNKIRPEYVYKAIAVVERGSADIVYAKPIMFGDKNAERSFAAKPFNILDLTIENYIDACALYKKEVWAAVGGYDVQMPFPGQEDWEFWLNAHINGFKFAFLDEELFYYRIVENSMIVTTSALDINSLNFQYLVKKHAAFFAQKYAWLYHVSKVHERDIAHPFLSLVKYIYYTYIKRKSV